MIKFISPLSLLAGLLIALPGHSAPVTLECRKLEDYAVRWLVTLDEPASKLSLLTVSTGSTLSGDAYFGPKYIALEKEITRSRTMPSGKLLVVPLVVQVRLNRETSEFSLIGKDKKRGDKVTEGWCRPSKTSAKPLKF